MTKSLHKSTGVTNMFDDIRNRVLVAYVGAAMILTLLVTIY